MFLLFYNIKFAFFRIYSGDWGWGMGDWGLGIGDWGLGPISCCLGPKSRIPSPIPGEIYSRKKSK